jgi:hypothetical protein
VTTINVNTIAPAGSTLTVGDSGDTIVVPEVRVNTVKDAGGNTLWVSNGSGTLSSVSSGMGGALNLLSTQTASTTTSIDFTTQLTSTYKEYVIKWLNMHPVNDGAAGFVVYASTDNTNWNSIYITSTLFTAQHAENDSEATLEFYSDWSQGQGTDAQASVTNVGNANDECGNGEFHIFNPASTTYVKNFYGVAVSAASNDYVMNQYTAGYWNTTSAITGLRIRFGSGDIQSGTAKLYGIS